ncbi:hypothetical protein [Gordonia sp. (in: high G+C Gram-positive bacteria)]|uniref:hypothetical protein n=1 Tax=Gordonia sp. (in: high G+C Gram-positive bacteria) TaxID=84139 RepID=UPI00333EAF1A
MTIRTVEISGDRMHGKSRLAMLAVVDAAITAGHRVLHVSERIVEATEALDRVAALIPRHMVRSVRRSSPCRDIRLTNGGAVSFVSVQPDTGRGFDADLVVLDEVKDVDKVRQMITPCLLASSDPRMIIVHRAE